MHAFRPDRTSTFTEVETSFQCRKETHCEFCDQELPEWKRTLTPQCGANAPAVMNVNFDGRTYSFEVKPGPEGYKQFTEAIRRAFSLPDDSELNITFTCDEPIAVPLEIPPPPPAPSAFFHSFLVGQKRLCTSQGLADGQSNS